MNSHDEACARQIVAHSGLQRLELTPSHVLFRAAKLMRQEADTLERIAAKNEKMKCDCVDSGFVKVEKNGALVETVFSFCPKCGSRL
jgi:hypothetical protein